MKLAVMSDFHLGYNDDALPQAAEALNKALPLADAIIVAGDVFDSRIPKQETINEGLKLFHSFAKKLVAKNHARVSVIGEGGIEEESEFPPLVAIYGTHERRTKGLVNAIQLLESGGVVANCHAKTILIKKSRDAAGAPPERVAIQGMGGIPEEYAKNTLELLAPKPVPGAFNVFVFHQTLQEIIPQAGEETLKAADLPNGFDLYVDGHIHWTWDKVEGGKRIMLPGSTVVTQMRRKEMEPKGFYLFDTLAKSAEFIEIHTRPFEFVELEFKNAGLSEIAGKTSQAIGGIAEKYGEQKPLVKIKLSGTLAPGLQNSNLDLSPILRDWEGKMLLSIDRNLESAELEQKIERLRRLRQEKKSVRELGVEILRKKLEALARENPAAKGLAGKEEELFDLLAEDKTDDAIKKIAGN
ncbi:MAG: metallophosphoesterase [Candidatus Micrarchaeia archaeon]|jgi:DNA repair exonuclease SbcCD nuclease subunit